MDTGITSAIINVRITFSEKVKSLLSTSNIYQNNVGKYSATFMLFVINRPKQFLIQENEETIF